MPTNHAYDAVAAARTRAADQILSSAELLAIFVASGGDPEDLREVVEHGDEAHALNATQSTTSTSGTQATLDVANAFVRVQGEYAAIMPIVAAVAGKMERTGRSDEVVSQLKTIIKNEVPVKIRQVEIKGVVKPKAVKDRSDEARRSEMQKDAGALLSLTAAHEALAARGVTVERLQALESGAKALRGKVSDRSVRKGAAKGATALEHEAVKKQQAVWQDTWRVLDVAANKNESIRKLLEEAVGKKYR